MVDKSIDHSTRTRSIRTQYKICDLLPEIQDSINNKHQPLLVKFSKKEKRKTADACVNTEVSFKPSDSVIMYIKETDDNIADSDTDKDMEDASVKEDLDSTFEPETENSEVEENQFEEFDDHDIKPDSSPVYDSKLIVFWSCLLPLLNICRICHSAASITRVYKKGTMVVAKLLCEKSHESSWYSQPKVRDMAAGNITAAASVLFSGNTYQRKKKR